MTTRSKLLMSALAVASCAALAAGTGKESEASRHQVPTSPEGNVVVGLCDGETSAEVKGVKPGQALSRTQAQDVSDRLMSDWKKKHPEAKWDDEVKLAQAAKPAAPATPANGAGAAGGTASAPAPSPDQSKLQTAHTYGAFTDRDEAIWKASTQEFITRGNQIFHDAKQLGGTVAISCDMCHPNASNTHPETYPKYQTQLGRVALLRDMINWCIENPVKGKPLADGDPKLKAIEAYILSERKGVKLEYGKH